MAATAAGVTRNIGTNFTVSGIAQSRTQLQKFAESVKSIFADIGKALMKAFEPLKKVADLSFDKLKKGAEFAFKGIAGAAILAQLKIRAIAAAVTELTKSMAEQTTELDRNARRLGMSAQDVKVLQTAFQGQGIDSDEVLGTLSDIANNFKDVKNQIDAANLSFAKTKDWEKIKSAARGNTADAVKEAMDADTAAASGSFSGIADRQRTIIALLKATAGDDTAGNRRLDLVEEYKKLQQAQHNLEQSYGPQGQALFALEKYGLNVEDAMQGGIKGLYALSDAFQQIQDPIEKTHIAVQLFGDDAGAKMVTILDQGSAGIERYREQVQRLGAQVTDQDTANAEKYTSNLNTLKLAFEGLKLSLSREILPLMMQSQAELTNWIVNNRDAIVKYLKEAFVSTRNLIQDILSMFGGKRGDFATGWINSIAPAIFYVIDLMDKARIQFGLIFSGADSNWEWLNKTRDAILEVISFIGDAWSVVWGGKATDYTWLNTAADWVKYLAGLVVGLKDNFKQLYEGKAPDWAWVAALADWLKTARAFAVDLWTVITGGQAKTFGFMNQWKASITEFAAEAKEALKIVFDALIALRHAAEWVISWMTDINPGSILLVAAFGRIALAVTGLGGAAGLAFTALRNVFAMGARVAALPVGAAVAAGSLAPTVAAAAAPAAGRLASVFTTAAAGGAASAAGSVATGVAATTVGQAVARGTVMEGLSALGQAAAGLAGRFGAVAASTLGLATGIGTAVAVIGGALYLGKKLYDYADQSTDKVLAAQSALIRAQAEPQLQAREDFRYKNDAAYAAKVNDGASNSTFYTDKLKFTNEHTWTAQALEDSGIYDRPDLVGRGRILPEDLGMSGGQTINVNLKAPGMPDGRGTVDAAGAAIYQALNNN